jgi:hypothetical protein
MPEGRAKLEYRVKLVELLENTLQAYAEAGRVLELETDVVPRSMIVAAQKQWEANNSGAEASEIMSSYSSVPHTEGSEDERETPKPTETFQGDMERYDLPVKIGKGFVEGLIQLTPKVELILRSAFKRFTNFKFYMEYNIIMDRQQLESPDGREVRDVKLTTTNDSGQFTSIRKESDIETAIKDCFSKLLDSLSDFNTEGSGFGFSKAISLSMFVTRQFLAINKELERQQPIADDDKGKEKEVEASDYSDMESAGSWIKLPSWLSKHTASIISPKNMYDDRCFEYCIMRVLLKGVEGHDVRHLGDITDLKPFLGKMVKLPTGVTYPIPLKDKVLLGIEELNPEFSFSIFSLGNRVAEIRPMYISNKKGQGNRVHIQLGLITGEKATGWSFAMTSHFVVIKSLSAIADGYSGNKRYFCESCLSSHKTERALIEHERLCQSHEPTHVVMPEEGSSRQFLTFKNWKNTMKMPWAIYGDFETIINPDTKEHTVSGACYKIVCTYPHHELLEGIGGLPMGKLRTFMGKHAMSNFIESLDFDANILEEESRKNIPMEPLTASEENAFAENNTCHICKHPILMMHAKVKDHDHYTGKYRGPAHNTCNIMFSASSHFKIPVIFHNLGGFDGYFIVRALANMYAELGLQGKMKVVAKNMRKYTTITVGNLKFIDSFQFLKGSLDELVENYKDEQSIPHLKTTVTGDEKEVKESQDKLDRQRRKSCYEQNKTKFPLIYDYCMDYDADVEMREAMDMSITENIKFCRLASKRFELLVRKGVYPYEYMDHWKKFKLRELPARKHFFSQLNNRDVEEEDYKRGLDVWKAFGCKDMMDYTRIYLEIDVLLLASIFEKFRDVNLQEGACGLDPVYYPTAPSLSWDAMLKMNLEDDIKIENFTNEEMYLMVEEGIRGGMCQVFNPYACANKVDPLMAPSLPGNQEAWFNEAISFSEYLDRIILHLDANNLYGWAMMQMLYQGDPRWEKLRAGLKLPSYYDKRLNRNGYAPPTKEQLDFYKGDEDQNPNNRSVDIWSDDNRCYWKQDILSMDPEGVWGYILEVDLEYPEHLHDEHNDYPLCPEHKVPTPSPYTLEVMEKVGVKPSKVSKLVCDLTNKTNYVIHLRNLQQALKLGLKLTQIHRVIAFRQSKWLSKYIEYNTNQRKKAKNSIEKDYWKLLNNSVFGKTMEQIRKRREVEIFFAADCKRAVKLMSTPYAKSADIIINDRCVIIEKARHKVVMDRPTVLGMIILDLSKWLMFDFHYNKMRAKFGSRATLLYTDTDSLIYSLTAKPGRTVNNELVKMQINTDCFDLSEMKNLFHPMMTLWSREARMQNAKVPGKFKDESFGYDIEEFVAVRSKMYSLLKNIPEGQYAYSKMKGIPEKARKEDVEGSSITHEDYMNVFCGGIMPSVSFWRLGHDSKLNIRTLEVNKSGLSAADDKSYYFDSATCLRHGHAGIARQHDIIRDWLKDEREQEEKEGGGEQEDLGVV